MKKSVVAAIAALALLVPASSALASEEAQPLAPCPPGTIGVTVYYQDPRGWITVDIPLCFSISH